MKKKLYKKIYFKFSQVCFFERKQFITENL